MEGKGSGSFVPPPFVIHTFLALPVQRTQCRARRPFAGLFL
jgi:hypothetical protein